jgi:hypothetical protein
MTSKGVVTEIANVFSGTLQEWEDDSNDHRPYRGLGPRCERLRSTTTPACQLTSSVAPSRA